MARSRSHSLSELHCSSRRRSCEGQLRATLAERVYHPMLPTASPIELFSLSPGFSVH